MIMVDHNKNEKLNKKTEQQHY